MSIGEKIASLRKQRGMSQEDLAAEMKVTRQAVSRWEQNEGIPDTENIVQLSKIFGVTTDFLLKNGEFTAITAGEPKKPMPKLFHRLFDTGFVYIIATGVYLVLGFGFGLWHPGWMIYAALGIIHGAMSAWFGDDTDKD